MRVCPCVVIAEDWYKLSLRSVANVTPSGPSKIANGPGNEVITLLLIVSIHM